jgi:hypothetical protein
MEITIIGTFNVLTSHQRLAHSKSYCLEWASLCVDLHGENEPCYEIPISVTSPLLKTTYMREVCRYCVITGKLVTYYD